MRAFRSRYARRVLVPVMAVSVLSACGGYGHQRRTLKEVLDERPSEARLTMIDGTQVELERPQVSGVYVIGQTENTEHGAIPTIVRLPVDSVAYAVTRYDNHALIKVLVGVALVITLAHIVIKSLADSYDGPFAGCCR